MLLRAAVVLALAPAAAACTEPAPPDGPAVISGVGRIELPVSRNRNLDLLFVIDNSPGVAPYRAKLVESYRRFIEALEARKDGLPDLHVGVITTDVGTRGAYEASGPAIGTGPGSCTSEGDAGLLRRVPGMGGNFLFDLALPDGSRERSYAGSLADVFAQLADVGEAGCTYARPLEAVRRAFGHPANEGFFRSDAALAIVMLTNDDDCSFGRASLLDGELDRSRCAADPGALVPIDEYEAFFKAFKGRGLGLYVLGAFAPPGGPACADARPAPRLDAFLGRFPSRSLAVPICEPDLSGVLAPTEHTVRGLLPAPCFEPPLLDADPIADGVQPDCAAWYRYELRGELVEEIIPACQGDAPGPCYHLGPDPLTCTRGLEVELREPRPRFGSGSGALAFLECVIR